MGPSLPIHDRRGAEQEKIISIEVDRARGEFAGLSAAIRALPTDQWLRAFNEWVGGVGAWGIVIFIVVYVIATILLVPGSALTVGAGFVFGLGWGLLAVSLGSTIGAALAFLITRFVAREKITSIAKKNESFGRIDAAIGEQGAKLVFLLRLSPLIPFNLSNYFYGLKRR